MDDGVGRKVFCLLCMQIRMNWRQVCAHESDDDGKKRGRKVWCYYVQVQDEGDDRENK